MRFERPTPKPSMADEVERLREEIARDRRARQRALENPPAPKTKTGQKRTRAKGALPAYCQHPSDAHPAMLCHRPTIARSPASKLPACWAHYKRERKALIAEHEADREGD